MLEDAASRSRESVATRWHRVRRNWRVLIQAGLAVAGAWAVAKGVWGHKQPFFAPVSAVIALGTSYYERGRRAFELVAAVVLGIAVADVLAYWVGTGIVQLAVAVSVAIALGLFFGSSQLFVNQVAVSAVLVFTVSPAASHFSFARAVDALTGGSIALAVAAIVFPIDPVRILRGAAQPVLDELASTLDDVARALRTRDEEVAESSLVRARGIDELGEAFFAATREGRSAVRWSPARRRARDTVSFFTEAAARIDLAVRNVRVLARGVMRALSLNENVPPDVAEAVASLAEAVRAFRRLLEDDAEFDAVRDLAVRAAVTATRVLEGTTNLSVSVIVGQVRSTAVDLLTGIGMSYDEATGAVRGAVDA
jgi:uncharacterized membrane protein YgaE (UPF0421/DUF939 family)